jgi:hypothetical protein
MIDSVQDHWKKFHDDKEAVSVIIKRFVYDPKAGEVKIIGNCEWCRQHVYYQPIKEVTDYDF